MASPKDVTINNLTGKWVLDRGLSDNLEEALTIQGVPFLIRKIMLMVNVTETVQETTNADGIQGLLVTKAAAGLKGQADAFDGTGKEVIMGGGGYFGAEVRVRSWWVDLSSDSKPKHPTGEPLDPYLLKDWIAEGPKGVPGHFAGSGEKAGVKDNMFWGFCQIGGKRYRAVKYYIRKGDREVRARLVFGWVGKE
ncbi:hypothetical protein QBC46DRAFT_453675 [Diplogelasinospora grovesii]|uniref:Uncharacterized protein n=1 Tax=Diplogelasinospora grovesii TaxID=303347 RepID=A0AAN6MX90_9PEZI|nr:hypothetical protein QBC46DRAFT_453675 [Diplogelasinospora grovesii]